MLICDFPGSGVFVVGTCKGNVDIPGKVAPWALPLCLCKHDTCYLFVELCSKVAALSHFFFSALGTRQYLELGEI